MVAVVAAVVGRVSSRHAGLHSGHFGRPPGPLCRPLLPAHSAGHSPLGAGHKPSGSVLLAGHLGPDGRLRLPLTPRPLRSGLPLHRSRRDSSLHTRPGCHIRVPPPGPPSPPVLREFARLHRRIRRLLRQLVEGGVENAGTVHFAEGGCRGGFHPVRRRSHGGVAHPQEHLRPAFRRSH